MTQLFDIVRDLLSEHSMVVVPGLGGFVCNRTAATLDKKTGRFSPGGVEILYNQKVLHNDGLLTEAVAKHEGITMDEAGRQIATIVGGITASLAKSQRAELAGLGILEKDGRSIILHASTKVVTDLETFGLHDFYFPEIDTKEAERRGIDKESRRDSSSSKMIAAAAVAGLLFFSQPVQNDHTQAYQASFAFQNPCDIVAAQSAERITRYCIVAKRCSSLEDADSYVAANTDKMVAGISLSTLQIGGEYLVSLSENESWEQTMQTYESVKEQLGEDSTPFILCREVEKK